MFYRWGHFAYRFRRVIPAVVIAVIVLLQVFFGSKLGERMSQEGWEDPHADSTAAARIEEDTFGRDSSGDVIVLVDAPGGLTTGPVFDEASRQISELKQRYPEQIDSVASYFASPNPQQVNAEGTRAFAAISLKGDGEQTLMAVGKCFASKAGYAEGIAQTLGRIWCPG